MVEAAPGADSVLFQHAQAGRRLAGIGNAGVGPDGQRGIPCREGSNPREALNKVQGDALGGQQRSGVTGDGRQRGPTLPHPRAITQMCLPNGLWIDQMKCHFSDGQPGDHARLLGEHDGGRPRPGRDTQNRSNIPRPDIFGECSADEGFVLECRNVHNVLN